MSEPTDVLSGWDRVAQAVANVQNRVVRVTTALSAAKVPYAVIGDVAVQEWVARYDTAAVRYTNRVEILLRREELSTAIAPLEAVDFIFTGGEDNPHFLDEPDFKHRDAIKIVYANELAIHNDFHPAPDVTESDNTGRFPVLTCEALVRMELTRNRTNNRLNVRDLLDVEAVDASWITRLPGNLRPRFQELVDDPDG